MLALVMLKLLVFTKMDHMFIPLLKRNCSGCPKHQKSENTSYIIPYKTYKFKNHVTIKRSIQSNGDIAK